MLSGKALGEQVNPQKGSAKLFTSNQFVELFEADKNRLYSYIYAFVANTAAADDIFQETCLALWKDFENFELGTNFSKWANGIAFNRILTFKRQQKKYTLGLGEDFLLELKNDLSVIEQQTMALEKKWQYLEVCCRSLSPPLLQIYNSFYVNNLTAQEISRSTNRSIHAIRKAVHKVRKKLFDCVQNKVQEGSK